MQILQPVVSCNSNKSIARQTGLSARSVETYRFRACRKLACLHEETSCVMAPIVDGLFLIEVLMSLGAKCRPFRQLILLCAGPRDDLDGEIFRTFVGVKIAVELAAPLNTLRLHGLLGYKRSRVGSLHRRHHRGGCASQTSHTA